MSRHIWIKALPVAFALSLVMGVEAKAAGLTFTSVSVGASANRTDGANLPPGSCSTNGDVKDGFCGSYTNGIYPKSVSATYSPITPGNSSSNGSGFISSSTASGSSTNGSGNGFLQVGYTDTGTLTSGSLAIGTPVSITWTLEGNSNPSFSYSGSGSSAGTNLSLSLSRQTYNLDGTIQSPYGGGAYYSREYFSNGNNTGSNFQTYTNTFNSVIGARIDWSGGYFITAGIQGTGSASTSAAFTFSINSVSLRNSNGSIGPDVSSSVGYITALGLSSGVGTTTSVLDVLFPTAVPEPSAMLGTLAVGLMGSVMFLRRFRQA